jgi:RNA polymerase sigma factor (sigma-70 family)
VQFNGKFYPLLRSESFECLVTELTDANLIEQVRQHGDKQAFSLLLERHQARALRMAQRMIAHGDTAREVVQEAMLEAYLSLSSLQQPERFQSWLYGIVINLCRAHLRRRQYDPLSLEAISGGLEATPALLISHAPDPQAIVEMWELHKLVRSAIDTLSPQNQQAVLLFYYEQLSLREIGLLLGISVAAVKGRLYKSRRQLADYFTAFASREIGSSKLSTTREINLERNKKMIEVQVADIIVEERDDQEYYVVILLDERGQRLLPIWIGPAEANGIAFYLLEISTPRPMTYDFMANLLQATGAVLEEIQISSLQEITFYATAFLRVGETIQQIDARPSDAIALALRMKSKISVAENVLTQSGEVIPERFRGHAAGKGLEYQVAKMDEVKQKGEIMLAKFKERTEEEVKQARANLIARVFGEAA